MFFKVDTRGMPRSMSLIYVTKLEEDRKTMQHPSKVQIFISTLWNICRLLAILWLCIAALTIFARARDQNSKWIRRLRGAAKSPEKKAGASVAPAKPVRPVKPRPQAEPTPPPPFIPAINAFNEDA